MSVGVTSAVLASIVALAVAIGILFRRPWRNLYGYFAAFAFTLAFWHAASLARHVTGSFNPLQGLAAVLIAPTAFLFFLRLLGAWSLKTQRMLYGVIGVALLLIPWTFTRFGKLPLLQIIQVTNVCGVLLLVLQSLLVHVRKTRHKGDRRRLGFLILGGLTALILAAGEFVPTTSVPSAAGHIAVTLYVYFLYQSIISQRLIDLAELVSKAAVLAVLTLVLATVYSLLVLWVGADQPGLWLFNTLVASFVILILYDQIRPWVEHGARRLVLRDRYRLRRTVALATQQLRTTISVETMRDKILDAIEQSKQVTHVALYLATEGEMSFVLTGYRGSNPPASMSITQQPTLVQTLRRQRRPILLDQLQQRQGRHGTELTQMDATWERARSRDEEAITAMRSFHASLILPMLYEDRIVGVLTLGQGDGTAPYATQDIAALLSLAEAAAVVVESSQEYERRRQRDRLAAIGEMATGMAHEIRNPLGAIKGAAQCLDPDELSDSSREFVDVIVEEVDRLNGVVSQFLEYARPYRGHPESVDINDIIVMTCKLIAKDLPEAIHIQQDLAHGLPAVCADPEHMKQVLLNLMFNAAQAMPTGGNIVLHTAVHYSRDDAATQNDHTPNEETVSALREEVVLQIRDTGVGIANDNLQNIFVPFFTTKDTGTGLGLSITQRIVENFGGHIDVHSRLGQGTTLTIRMPAVQHRPNNDNA